MGLREDMGGKVEDVLNKLVDEHLSAEKLMPLLVAVLAPKIAELKQKIKADVIDRIDGVDDIK